MWSNNINSYYEVTAPLFLILIFVILKIIYKFLLGR